MLSLHFHTLIVTYGVAALFVLVCLESMGLPLPGESALIAFALYAGTHPDFSIVAVIVAASAGAIIGDNIGYEIGRHLGYRLLLRYGRHVRLTEPRLKIGQYLFARYGGWVVFLGRFAAILRTFAALLAGANCMPWKRFFVCNAVGGIAWAALYAGGAYVLGRSVREVLGPLAIVMAVLGLGAMIGGAIVIKRHEKRWAFEAERARPGPLSAQV